MATGGVSRAEFGELERPDYEQLYETTGVLAALAVEQEGSRDSVYLTLRIDHEDAPSEMRDFVIFLDGNSSVALAQLQLLRDALWSRWYERAHEEADELFLVTVRFNFLTSSRKVGVVYTVGVRPWPKGTPVERVYPSPLSGGWYLPAYFEIPE